jgi:RNA polymerase sigma-70 factor (ECF subfamily)
VLDFVMTTTDPACPPLPVEDWTDERVVARVLQGEVLLFEVLMRRHNQRIYRAIRSILWDDSECEDVMQETYVRAFEHLAQFEGRARFSTWLTRIAVNESIKRSVARRKIDPLHEDSDGDLEILLASDQNTPSPETSAARVELAALLEDSILALPPVYRTVLMLRDIEEMSTSETAEVLAITDTNVKVRLHRAHELLRTELMTRAGATSPQAFMFPATRCNRVVDAVFHRLNLSR